MRASGVVERRGGSDPAATDEAFADLYAAHWAGLVRLAWLLVHDQGRAQDVVQDVFVASWDRLAELRERGTALAYLRRGVVNRCTSAHRRRGVEDRWLRSTVGGEDDPTTRTVPSAEDQALVRTEGSALIDALARLPQRQREVVVLRYWSDLSEAQVAELLGVSAGAVKSHAHRGLVALRSVLGGPR